jgi:hypothetical protein
VLTGSWSGPRAGQCALPRSPQWIAELLAELKSRSPHTECRHPHNECRQAPCHRTWSGQYMYDVGREGVYREFTLPAAGTGQHAATDFGTALHGKPRASGGCTPTAQLSWRKGRTDWRWWLAMINLLRRRTGYWHVRTAGMRDAGGWGRGEIASASGRPS